MPPNGPAGAPGPRRLVSGRLAVVSAIVLGVVLAAIAFAAASARDGAPTGAIGFISRAGWLLVAVGWWGPLLAFLVFRVATFRRAPRIRTTIRMLAESGGLAAGWYLLLWLHAWDLFAGSGWLRAVALAGIVVLGSMVLMWGLRGLLQLLAVRWAVRRSDLRPGGGRWVGGLIIALGLASAIATVITVLGVRRPVPPSELSLDPAPVRRLVFWAVDGIDQNQLAYWTALRSESTVSALALNGASTYLGWAPGPVTWMEALSGKDPRRAKEDAPAAGSLPGGRIELGDAVKAAYPRVTRPWMEGERFPGFWEVASWGGRAIDIIGWSWFVSAPGPRDQIIYPPAYMALRAAREGDSHPLTSGRGGDPELLMPLRELARPPGLDWRAGAEATDAEAETFRRAAELGVDPERLWDDRFRLRTALAMLERDRRDLQALYLDFPLRLADGAASAAPDDAERLNRAVYAYLDVLDQFVGALRSQLRPGDLLALLFVPPPLVSGASAGQRGTATLILYGEKAALETSEPGAMEVPDIATTMLYLTGQRLSEELAGQVGWSLLLPDLQEHIPVGTLTSYGRVQVVP